VSSGSCWRRPMAARASCPRRPVHSSARLKDLTLIARTPPCVRCGRSKAPRARGVSGEGPCAPRAPDAGSRRRDAARAGTRHGTARHGAPTPSSGQPLWPRTALPRHSARALPMLFMSQATAGRADPVPGRPRAPRCAPLWTAPDGTLPPVPAAPPVVRA
jgi:hypothetical protein